MKPDAVSVPPATTPVTTPASADSKSTWLAPALAGVAGLVDTSGFIVFAGVFLAHITGNFVVLGATLSGQEHGSTALKLAVLPLFIVGVALGWLLVRVSPRKAARHLATSEGLLLLICGGLGAWSLRAGSMSHTTELVEIACGVLAMGLQSMLARSLKLPMTHVMTGNVTQLTVDVLDSRFSRSESLAAARKNVWLVAAFAGGASIAGLLVPSFGLAVLLIPAVLLLGVAQKLD